MHITLHGSTRCLAMFPTHPHPEPHTLFVSFTKRARRPRSWFASRPLPHPMCTLFKNLEAPLKKIIITNLTFLSDGEINPTKECWYNFSPLCKCNFVNMEAAEQGPLWLLIYKNAEQFPPLVNLCERTLVFSLAPQIPHTSTCLLLPAAGYLCISYNFLQLCFKEFKINKGCMCWESKGHWF